MRQIVTIIKYLLWLLISIFAGMGCMRIEIGKSIKTEGFFAIFNILYDFIIICIGGSIGLISFIPFVLIDIFYIKRKIETKLNQSITRIFTVLILCAANTLIHYVLEFKLDWI